MLDPVRYFEAKIGKNEEFSLKFEEPKQDHPFEVVFERKSKSIFFEVDEVPEEHVPQSHKDRIANPTWKDNLIKTYYAMRGKTDFRFQTRGIRQDAD